MWVWNFTASAPASAIASTNACAVPRLPSCACPTSPTISGRSSQDSGSGLVDMAVDGTAPCLAEQRRVQAPGEAARELARRDAAPRLDRTPLARHPRQPAQHVAPGGE